MTEHSARTARPPAAISQSHSPWEGSTTHGASSVHPENGDSDGDGSGDGDGDEETSGEGSGEGSEVWDSDGWLGDGPVGAGDGSSVGETSAAGISRAGRGADSETDDEPAHSEDEADDGCGPVAAHEAEDGTSNTNSTKQRLHSSLRTERSMKMTRVGQARCPAKAL